MPKYPFAISIPVLAASAFALCWLTPLPAFEASAELSTENYSVSKQLFDPDVFGNVRSSFSRSVSTSDQPIVERRSMGRTTESMKIPAQIKEAVPAESQCEPKSSTRKNEPQFGSLQQGSSIG
jgi:hypothetical protein